MSWDIKETLENWGWGMIGSMSDFAADLLEAIPVPDFLQQLPSNMSAIPASAIYFATPFELKYGVTVISAAIIARMLLTLVPFVGDMFK